MRSADWARLLVAVLWLLAPAILHLVVTGGGTARFAAGLLMVSAGTLLLPALWTRTLRGALLGLTPIALLAGFATLYLWLYQTPLTAGLVQSLLETDPREAHEQASRYAMIALACIAGTGLFIYCAWTLPRDLRLPFRGVLAAGALWSVVLALYYPYVEFELRHRLDVITDMSFVRKSWPANVAFAVADLREAAGLTLFEDDVADAPPAPLPPERQLRGDQREIFVLVIGEAAQAHIWEELDTLRERRGLVYFGDALAQANLSRASVEMLVTGATTLAQAATSPTIVDWQNAAGCKTAVVSNTSAFRFAKRAAIRFATAKEEHDHDLLPVIGNLVANTALRKLCIVVHMIGSHQDYRERYAERFARFPTTGYPALPGLRGAYRNSILASQDFLGELIGLLARPGERAFLAFTADHGENLLEINGLIEHGSMTPTEFEMRVPMLYWSSPAFIEQRPEQWAQLQRNRAVPVSNAHVVPTLLDAMGILDDVTRRQPQAASLLRPYAPEGPRTFVTPDFANHPESGLLRAPR